MYQNGNLNCHYRTDDQQKDYSSYDPASLNILSKLDVILKEKESGNSNTGTISTNSTDKPSPDDPSSMSSTFSPAPTQQQQQQQQQHPQRLTKAQGKNSHLINVFGICQFYQYSNGIFQKYIQFIIKRY